MSKRLQVLLEEAEYRRIQRVARKNGMTVSEWVRRALAVASRETSLKRADKKLAVVRAALEHSFPTADIGDMLDEIERGYSQDLA